jgi:hypothetical protein
MNPYTMIASASGTGTLSVLAARLAAWHDSMVAHERRLRTGRTSDVCDDECPHVEARSLWAEAVAAFGERAHELSFLRSRATSAARGIADAVAERSRESGRAGSGRSADGERRRAARGPGSRPAGEPLRSPHPVREAEL